MEFGTIIILSCICAICRCIMFKRRDITWWKALIPGVNKYLLGKLVKSKKLAIANAISYVLFEISFIACFGYELWIIQNYAQEVYIPKNGAVQSTIQVLVPENVANIAIWSKYGLIAIALVALIVWCMVMWRFTLQHNKNPWWICLWAVAPVIPYIYFTISPEFVAIDGKKYTIKKVEIK